MVPERIRNVALVGHGGSGKTSLAEALLFVAGATTRQGSVDDGTTILDFEPEEVDRKISLGISVASVDWNGHRINLIDTPGYADFSGEARSALHAADLALFVVSAVDGVEVQHEILWKFAEEENIPRAVVVTKLDRERASFGATLEQLRAVFGKRIAPIQVPVGAEASLSGLARVVTGKVFTYPDGAKRGVETADVPADVQGVVDEAHTALIESVVETDDELMMAYFEGEEPSRDVIVRTVHNGMLEGEIYPVLVSSASKLFGVDMLAEFVVDFGPNPLEHATPPVDAGTLEVAKDGATVAYVF